MYWSKVGLPHMILCLYHLPLVVYNEVIGCAWTSIFFSLCPIQVAGCIDFNSGTLILLHIVVCAYLYACRYSETHMEKLYDSI